MRARLPKLRSGSTPRCCWCTDTSGMARSIARDGGGLSRTSIAHLECRGYHLQSRRQPRTSRFAAAWRRPEVPVVGGFPGEADLAFPERHLGLRSADEDRCAAATVLTRGASSRHDWLDLDAIISIARAAPALDPDASVSSRALQRPSAMPNRRSHGTTRFTSTMKTIFAASRKAAPEIVSFSPSRDRELPAVDGLYFGGGYPEVLAPSCRPTRGMIDGGAATSRHRGGPIYAECGGLMYL